MRVVIKNDKAGRGPTTLQNIGDDSTVADLMAKVKNDATLGKSLFGDAWCFARYDGSRLSSQSPGSALFEITSNIEKENYAWDNLIIHEDTPFVTFYNKVLDFNKDEQRAADFECRENVLQIDNLMISLYNSNLDGDFDIKKVSEYGLTDSESNEFFMACDAMEALKIDLQISKTEASQPLVYGVKVTAGDDTSSITAFPFNKAISVKDAPASDLYFKILAPLEVDFAIATCDGVAIPISSYQDSPKTLAGKHDLHDGVALKLRSWKYPGNAPSLSELGLSGGDDDVLTIVDPRKFHLEVGSGPTVIKFELATNCSTIDELKCEIAKSLYILPDNFELELKNQTPLMNKTPLKAKNTLASYPKLKNDSTLVVQVKSKVFEWQERSLCDILIHLVSPQDYNKILLGDLEIGGVAQASPPQNSQPEKSHKKKTANGTPPASQTPLTQYNNTYEESQDLAGFEALLADHEKEIAESSSQKQKSSQKSQPSSQKGSATPAKPTKTPSSQNLSQTPSQTTKTPSQTTKTPLGKTDKLEASPSPSLLSQTPMKAQTLNFDDEVGSDSETFDNEAAVLAADAAESGEEEVSCAQPMRLDKVFDDLDTPEEDDTLLTKKPKATPHKTEKTPNKPDVILLDEDTEEEKDEQQDEPEGEKEEEEQEEQQKEQKQEDDEATEEESEGEKKNQEKSQVKGQEKAEEKESKGEENGSEEKDDFGDVVFQSQEDKEVEEAPEEQGEAPKKSKKSTNEQNEATKKQSSTKKSEPKKDQTQKSTKSKDEEKETPSKSKGAGKEKSSKSNEEKEKPSKSKAEEKEKATKSKGEEKEKKSSSNGKQATEKSTKEKSKKEKEKEKEAEKPKEKSKEKPKEKAKETAKATKEKPKEKTKEKTKEKEKEAEQDDNFTVEKVVDRRVKDDGKIQFKVHWMGYSDAEDTWEYEEDLVDGGYKPLVATFMKSAKGERAKKKAEDKPTGKRKNTAEEEKDTKRAKTDNKDGKTKTKAEEESDTKKRKKSSETKTKTNDATNKSKATKKSKVEEEEEDHEEQEEPKKNTAKKSNKTTKETKAKKASTKEQAEEEEETDKSKKGKKGKGEEVADVEIALDKSARKGVRVEVISGSGDEDSMWVDDSPATFADISGVIGARASLHDNKLEIAVQWSDARRSYIPAELLRKHRPSLLIDFYESKIRFVD